MTINIKFTLPAEAVEGASEAILLGDFNNWNPDYAPRLEKQEDGSYNAVLLLEVGQTYQYRFLLDGSRWVNDYNAQNYWLVPDLYIDNCVITVAESMAEESKEEKPVKAAAKKEVASKPKPAVKAQDTKKVSPKTKAVKVETEKDTKTKSSAAKAPVAKAEKPAKAVKKAAPKAKK